MSKTAVARKPAQGSTNIWHTSIIPQPDFVSKGEHGIITQKACFSHGKAATVTDTCPLLPVWVTSPRFSIFRKCLLLSRDKNSTQPLGEARFHSGRRQSSTWTNIHPTTHHSWFLQQLEDAHQIKGQQS